MTPSTVESVVAESSLGVRERSDRLAALLGAEPDHGLATAVEVLRTTADERVAAFVSDYVALLPDAGPAKVRAAERLRTAGPLVLSAARLVPWLTDDLLDGFVADYLAAPDPDSPLASVIFEISAFWPERLRRQGDRIDDPLLRRGLLAGAPDSWVDDRLARWHEEYDPDLLDSIARIRTPRAVQALLDLRDELGDPSRWETLIALAGRLPDRDERSWHLPAFMGSVVDRSVHVMGGSYPGDVPLCPVCEAPAERVLTLDSGSVGLGLASDPSFFWYSCDCAALDSVTVQIRPDGLRAFYVALGSSGPAGVLVPGERGMSLEPHPNQVGVSIDATGGFGQHQVGGAPRWVEPGPHPRCPVCGTVMRFVASVDSGLTPFGRLGFRGVLYGFWCDADAVSDTRHQG